jgi:prepilin-type N-terminal cleavage/methylation domain-containing protein
MKNKFDYIVFKNLIGNKNNGFTLIELLVVVIIVGVLAAVALPNYIAQIGKAREAEAKTGLGAVAHSQQAYHFESHSFYKGSDIRNLGVNPAGDYYAYTVDSIGISDKDKAIHTAYATDPTNSGARDFSIGVYYNAPQYSQTLCIATGVDSNGTSSSVAANTGGTCDGGNKIK